MRASYQTWACTQEWRLKQQRPTGAKTLACLIIPYCALCVPFYHYILNGTTPLMLWQHVQTKFHWTTMCAIAPPVKLLLRFISNFFSIVWLSECNVHCSIWNIFNSASNPCNCKSYSVWLSECSIWNIFNFASFSISSWYFNFKLNPICLAGWMQLQYLIPPHFQFLLKPDNWKLHSISLSGWLAPCKWIVWPDVCCKFFNLHAWFECTHPSCCALFNELHLPSLLKDNIIVGLWDRKIETRKH